MPKITLNPFSPSSIDKAVKEVQKYANDLPKKTKLLRQRIAAELADIAEVGFNGSTYDYVLNEGARVPDVRVSIADDGDISLVIAYGKEAVFAEFGAGVFWNGPAGSSPHPWGPKNLFFIGTYGKGHGARKIWGYYDEAGNLKLTHGTPASMPMYHATQEILNKIVQIARDVFKEGG